MNILLRLNEYVDIILENLGTYGPLLGCLFICVESILPFMPISAFITLNFLAYGNILGFAISWFFTILGCMLSFTLFKKKVKNWFDKKREKRKKVDKVMRAIEKLNFSQLVLIIAIPFTPAFLVNIAAGLTKMTYKRYLFALIIGKMFFVYFWGYIGVTLLESFKNPIIFIRVGVMLLIAYLISMLINKKLKLD